MTRSVRRHLAEKGVGASEGFHWRGGKEVLRLEGLSDAVFAFAITLLVVSLEVPKTFDELMVTMRGFFAFSICFALLFSIGTSSTSSSAATAFLSRLPRSPARDDLRQMHLTAKPSAP